MHAHISASIIWCAYQYTHIRTQTYFYTEQLRIQINEQSIYRKSLVQYTPWSLFYFTVGIIVLDFVWAASKNYFWNRLSQVLTNCRKKSQKGYDLYELLWFGQHLSFVCGEITFITHQLYIFTPIFETDEYRKMMEKERMKSKIKERNIRSLSKWQALICTCTHKNLQAHSIRSISLSFFCILRSHNSLTRTLFCMCVA